MAISPGTKLGPYEVIAPIGAGGMGEVYRAHDSRLGRDVAIKVLPEHLMADLGLRQRFEREAKAICKLSHPNICTLHDIGSQNGIDFLVMELIEGETLEQRLTRGALPTEQTLRVAAQIAEALARAHSQGVVHRDLKPSNVMLTKSGAKLMDFGLAKQSEIASFAAATVAEVTRDDAKLTGQGTLVGTFQYMSPEQLEGKTADARSDIFALGELIYEMATGRPAFAAKSRASLIAAILTTEPPPLSQVQPMTPPALERVVKRCLAKDPDERWQSASDLASELNWILAGGSQSGVMAQIARPHSSKTWIWVAAGLVIAVLASLVFWRAGTSKNPATQVNLSVSLPEEFSLANISTVPFSISRDGSTIVYSAVGADRKFRLYLRKLNSFETTPISGTEGAANATFSPDGKWIAFQSFDGLKKVPTNGGSPTHLSAEASPLGIEWDESNTIYFVRTFTSGIYSVSSEGGPSKRVLPQEGDSRVQLWPSVLPDHSGMIYTVWTGKSFNDARIEGYSFKTGERKTLLDGGTGARYLPSGHIVFGRNGTLYSVPFDAKRLAVSGTPTPVLEGVTMGAANGDSDFAVSDDGTLVYQPGTMMTFQRNLVSIDRAGKVTKIRDDVAPYATPSVSKDGTRIALTLEASSFDVWVYDLRRDILTKASFGADDYRPFISPNGEMLAYDSSKSGYQQLFLKHGILEGSEDALTSGPEGKELYGWTPDGKELIFGRQNKDSGWDLYAISVDGDHKVRTLVTEPFNQAKAALSPDGKWLAYASDESGQDEVFVVSMPDGRSRAQISTGGGTLPRWSRSGDEMFFISKGKILSVKFTRAEVLSPNKPTLLFEDKLEWSGYDVAPDGSFIVAREADAKKPATKFNVVLNWMSTLRK
jgi:eukaryotic-like serine/threonine-protein kinase